MAAAVSPVTAVSGRAVMSWGAMMSGRTMIPWITVMAAIVKPPWERVRIRVGVIGVRIRVRIWIIGRGWSVRGVRHMHSSCKFAIYYSLCIF
jgi:hypothetical protein